MTRAVGYASRWSNVNTSTPFENPANSSGGSVSAPPSIKTPDTTKTSVGTAIARWGGKSSSGSNTWGGSGYGTGWTGQTTGPSTSPYNAEHVFGYAFEATPAAPGAVTGPTYTGSTPTSNALSSHAERTAILRAAASTAPSRVSSTVQAVNDSSTPGSITFTIGNVTNGNLLLIEFEIDDPNASVVSADGTWTANFDVGHTGGRIMSFYKFAAATASGVTASFNVTSTAGPPTNTVAPAVTGTAALGSTLSTTNGTWDQSGLTYTYQWQRNTGTWANISGATSSTYTVGSGDVGNSVRCVVTATNSTPASASANSNSVSIPAAPVNTVTPSIPTGTYHTGDTLTVTPGTWTGSGITLAYQWYRGASPLSGQTGTTYTLVVTDEGANISVHEIASNGGAPSGVEASSNVIVPVVTAPITDDSFLTYLSGGVGNTDPALSIGGARGGTAPAGVNALIGPIIGAAAQGGGTFYRVVYVRNTHTISTVAGLKLYIEQQFAHPGLHVAAAVPAQAANATVPALASQTTAPTGVTWTTATDAAGGDAFGDLAPGDFRGIYLRITVDAGTTPTAEDDAVVAVQGSAA